MIIFLVKELTGYVSDMGHLAVCYWEDTHNCLTKGIMLVKDTLDSFVLLALSMDHGLCPFASVGNLVRTCTSTCIDWTGFLDGSSIFFWVLLVATMQSNLHLFPINAELANHLLIFYYFLKINLNQNKINKSKKKNKKKKLYKGWPAIPKGVAGHPRGPWGWMIHPKGQK
jgi:hypothetical protein